MRGRDQIVHVMPRRNRAGGRARTSRLLSSSSAPPQAAPPCRERTVSSPGDYHRQERGGGLRQHRHHQPVRKRHRRQELQGADAAPRALCALLPRWCSWRWGEFVVLVPRRGSRLLFAPSAPMWARCSSGLGCAMGTVHTSYVTQGGSSRIGCLSSFVFICDQGGNHNQQFFSSNSLTNSLTNPGRCRLQDKINNTPEYRGAAALC